MKTRMNMKFVFALLLALAVLRAPAVTLSKEATVSILTCSAGEEMYSLFGHTGIRVTDPARGLDVVFNYGTFDFDTPGFYLKFARGLLPYQLTYTTFARFKAAYEWEGRGVWEQRLLLDSAGRQRMMDLLEVNCRPENRSYLYNFLYDNCSTRVRDIIERSVGGKVEWRVAERERSFWELLDECMAPAPWIRWGIHTILGSPANADATVREEMFLPAYLMAGLDSAYCDGRRLAAPATVVVPEAARVEAPAWYARPGAVFLAVAAALFCLLWRFRRGRTLRAVAFPFFLATGGIGCLLVFLGGFTAHPTTAPNFNLVWANPLNLGVAAALFRRLLPRAARVYLAVYLWVLAAGAVCWWALTPAVLYSSLVVMAWMAYLAVRLRRAA